jgi:hypothetical protein
MKTITITIGDDGAVRSSFVGPALYEALGALEMTKDLVLQSIRQQQTMYSPEAKPPMDEQPPQINQN